MNPQPTDLARHRPPPDADLCRRLAVDLDGTFPTVVRTHQHHLYSGIRRIVGNPADAEDLTQEALVRAYRALAGYDRTRIEQLRLRGWLWTIAINLCRNRARSRSRSPGLVPILDHDAESAAPGPEEAAIDADRAQEVGALLMGLPRRQREAIVLRHVVGMTYPEITHAVGRPEGSVKSDVHRGLAALRSTLEGEPS